MCFASGKALTFLALVLALGSCTHYEEIYVRSMGFEVGKNPRLQFLSEDLSYVPLEVLTYQKTIFDACSTEAARREITVVPANETCENCLKIYPSVSFSSYEEISYVPPASTPFDRRCNRFGGRVQCVIGGGQTFGGYTKSSYKLKNAGVFSIRRLDTRSGRVEEIRRVKSTYFSDDEKFTSIGAEYLCRGFFEGLDKDVSQKFLLAPRSEEPK